jgi:hypothetical protein
MKNDNPRFYGALLTVLAMACVISIKMAFLHKAELLLLLLVIVPVMFSVVWRAKR